MSFPWSWSWHVVSMLKWLGRWGAYQSPPPHLVFIVSMQERTDQAWAYGFWKRNVSHLNSLLIISSCSRLFFFLKEWDNTLIKLQWLWNQTFSMTGHALHRQNNTWTQLTSQCTYLASYWKAPTGFQGFEPGSVIVLVPLPLEDHTGFQSGKCVGKHLRECTDTVVIP